MKECVLGFAKIVIFSFTISCCFLTLIRYGNKDLPVFFTNPLKIIQETIQSALEPRIERSVIQEPEAFMKTPEIIARRGYPIEIHHVVTDDGYILELHRIPFGRRGTPFENSTLKRKAVFLQHGLFLSDHMWLFSSSNNSLAYILADHGYDVWLGNSRGNVYSRKHVSLNPDTDREFWNFSWDEMGHYDIPASINYVLNATEEEKLTYIGYSSGVSTFFMGAIRNPELNDKVEVMIGLGPTVSMAHLNSFYRYMAPFVKSYQFFQQLIGIGEVHSNDGLFHLLTRRLFCETTHFVAEIGMHITFQIFGYSENYEKNLGFLSVGHHPSGSSANSFAHFLQNFNSGESFLYFDHGPAENLIRYGTTYPPDYNLTQVTVPVYLVHADNDDVAPKEDVNWLMSRLSNLKGSIRVDNPMFTHGDFIWSPRLAELVHHPILHLLPPPFA